MANELRVHHVGVIARDYDEMERWYERHLGFTVDSEWDEARVIQAYACA
jgi:catechol 2,3-dioxygenase-like lactoylglutathione lyase family enzyme